MHRNSLYYLSYFSSGDVFPEKLNAFHNAKNPGNFGRRSSETVVTVWPDRNIQGVVHFDRSDQKFAVTFYQTSSSLYFSTHVGNWD